MRISESKLQKLKPVKIDSQDFKTFVKVMDKIEKSFNLSEVPLPNVDLFEVPIHYLISSRNAFNNFYLSEGDIQEFFSSNHENYFLMGFWGHGFNSHAFYYVRADSKSKVFFRLPFDGIYLNNEKSAKQIGNFLKLFFDFESKIKEDINYFVALESFGQSKYEIVRHDGVKFIFEKSLLKSDDMEMDFSELLNALEN